MMKLIRNDKAVSPVIGIMLMIVVTVILAGAVSSFSGGFVKNAGTPTQAVIKADYSQTNGMTITHIGGDVVNTLGTKIIVSPTMDFGGYDHLSWAVNTTVVKIDKPSAKPWFDPTKYASDCARTFQSGEIAYINSTDIGEVQPKTYTGGATLNDSTNKNFGFKHTNTKGQRFILKLVDDKGKTVASTFVVVKP